MDRRGLLAASGWLAAAALAGCLDRGGPATTTDPPPNGDPGPADEPAAELVRGNAAFALDLHGHLADGSAANQFLSPYSVSVALAMTYAGARGETERQLRETLRYALGQDVHPAFAALQAAIDARGQTTDPESGDPVDAFELAVANALWGREGYPFSEDYLALVDRYYGGGLRRADFAGDPDGERDRINAWVADATADRIDDLLPAGSIDASTVLVLTNAIYFLAGWRFAFDPADTADAAFTALDGSTSTVPMMRQHLRTNYASVPGAEAVELPYVGDEVSMVLLLPEAGTFEAFERGLDAEALFGVFEALGDASGDLRLPRFEFETEVQLSAALADLGMPVAFGAGADFSGMVDEGAGDLWIDEVYHQAFVGVDEEGTEAAAATAVVMDESAPSTSFDLTLDRPFLFVIRDRPTDAVLFLGRVADAGA